MVYGDELFSYQTTKRVVIKDFRLGTLYYALLGVIILWVIGYEIMYRNGHFARYEVQGTAEMSIQQPTRDMCNPHEASCLSDFTPLTQLPYCTEYKGTAPARRQYNCVYADRHTMNPNGHVQERLFIPTRIDNTWEEKGCQPEEANGFTCDNEWIIKNRTGIRYVADIERATLKLSHSFSTIADGKVRTGASTRAGGLIVNCVQEAPQDPRVGQPLESERACAGGSVDVPIACVSAHCVEPAEVEEWRASTHETKDEEAARLIRDGIYAIPSGDIFRLGSLLDIAGLSLDSTFNEKGDPLRLAGTILIIDVLYSNLHPFTSTFGNKRLSYTYSVQARPLGEMKTESISDRGLCDPNTRVIQDMHGIMVLVQVRGELGLFSGMSLLLMLTTSVGLLAVANLLTDTLSLNVLGKRAHLDAMIEETDRLNRRGRHDADGEDSDDLLSSESSQAMASARRTRDFVREAKVAPGI